jgi:hypothetical protein
LAAALLRAYADGVSPGDVLCDCGYSNRDPKTFASILVIVEIDAKRRQKHEYPSNAHRFSCSRRTAAERTFAWFSDPATGGARRGWSRC